MTPDEDRIAQLYEAFNTRAFDRVIAGMTSDVSWPDEVEDRRLEGIDAVRDYFQTTTAPVRIQHQPIALFTPSPGQVEVLTRQTVVSEQDGSVWSSQRARHRFTMRDGLIARLDSQQNYVALTFEGVERLLQRLYDAINAQDVDAIMACYAPHARFQDELEDGELSGAEDIRAHFEHLFATMQVTLAIRDYALQPDDWTRARLQVEARGLNGHLWQDGGVTVWYRLESGRIVEQEIDDGDGTTR
ncbi:nuclear transport factor 2 family protein [Caulobacter sp. SL161]|uniref:nuclear transport factor 2 family protein n=1 Tax=Caulobacter sp. SL161 TaxID=2995156 RepID=UPI002276B3EC|nr:nuclear transport factor 2 family protein [Caulobacter sp. SL161]MCY1647205.1 nuclear transport factor 2 family protein [Caulobacter sp. SL161]